MAHEVSHGQTVGGQTASEALRRGDVVLAALAVFTAIEFAAAVAVEGNPLLAALAAVGLVKAALIVNYFMHFHQLWEHTARVWNAFLFPDTEHDDEDEDERGGPLS
jgi:cytochrome c oxidase subunit IV